MENEMKRGKTVGIEDNYRTDNLYKDGELKFQNMNFNNKIDKHKLKNNLSLNSKHAQNINHYSYKLNTKNM